MLGIGEEISVFLQAFLAGNTVFFTYSCIRVIRRLVKHNLFFISVEDFCFWIGTGLYLFLKIYHASDGSIRWFFVIGVVAGVCSAYGLICFIKKLHYRVSQKGENSIDKSKKRR